MERDRPKMHSCLAQRQPEHKGDQAQKQCAHRGCWYSGHRCAGRLKIIRISYRFHSKKTELYSPALAESVVV